MVKHGLCASLTLVAAALAMVAARFFFSTFTVALCAANFAQLEPLALASSAAPLDRVARGVWGWG